MKSLLQTTQNTRDLGAHATVDGKVTVCNRIYRSDRQEYPSQKDIDFLLARKITTIIDLRTQADTAVKPSGFANLEGFRYFNIPIEEGSAIPESADAVPGSYLRIACAENMRKVFEAIAQAEAGVMFNCAAGKDRSGVVAAILLMLCGVQEVEIIADYMLSKEANRERFELLKIKHPEIDMNSGWTSRTGSRALPLPCSARLSRRPDRTVRIWRVCARRIGRQPFSESRAIQTM